MIQEIETKKANKNGHAKEIITKYLPMSINGEDMGHWWYYYGEDKFERPVKKAYKISIHHSYRDNGKVKKKQFVLATVNYYDFANDFFYLYEDCDTKINEIAKAFNTDIDSIYDMVEAKIKPLQEQIQAEFMETEEYKTHEEHEQITTIHAANKTKFAETYNVDSSEYDRCYDVFGTLHNPQRLKEIQQQAEFNRQYEEKSRRYQEQYYGNYH